MLKFCSCFHNCAKKVQLFSAAPFFCFAERSSRFNQAFFNQPLHLIVDGLLVDVGSQETGSAGQQIIAVTVHTIQLNPS